MPDKSIKDKEMGFYAAPATCEVCSREWTAVYPEVCERLECPGCGYMTRAPHLVEVDRDESEEKEPWQA
jgi:hypothetical protein